MPSRSSSFRPVGNGRSLSVQGYTCATRLQLRGEKRALGNGGVPQALHLDASLIQREGSEIIIPTYTLKELWAKACAHDAIPASSKFVVFSKDNPWIMRYNNLILAVHTQSTNEACELLANRHKLPEIIRVEAAARFFAHEGDHVPPTCLCGSVLSAGASANLR